jgi:hypothetical protein
VKVEGVSKVNNTKKKERKKTLGRETTQSSFCLVKDVELYLWCPILRVDLGILCFVEKGAALLV